jgi:hypothetical protein
MSDRDGALGDRVPELPPDIDQLVELEVQRAELAPDDGPVQLLAVQRQIDQLDKRV